MADGAQHLLHPPLAAPALGKTTGVHLHLLLLLSEVDEEVVGATGPVVVVEGKEDAGGEGEVKREEEVVETGGEEVMGEEGRGRARGRGGGGAGGKRDDNETTDWAKAGPTGQADTAADSSTAPVDTPVDIPAHEGGIAI